MRQALGRAADRVTQANQTWVVLALAVLVMAGGMVGDGADVAQSSEESLGSELDRLQTVESETRAEFRAQFGFVPMPRFIDVLMQSAEVGIRWGHAHPGVGQMAGHAMIGGAAGLVALQSIGAYRVRRERA